MEETGTDMIQRNPTGFAIVDDSEAREVMAQVESLGISNYQLNRLRMPAGGGVSWEIEDLEGTRSEAKLDVIILAVKGQQKAWWKVAYEQAGGGSPPDCSSQDGVFGFGMNTLDESAVAEKHQCASCAWNEFGSSRGAGAGKDCSDNALVFFYREHSRIPSLLVASSTSIQPLNKYIFDLLDAGKAMQGCITTLALRRAQSKSGIAYSVLDLKWKRDLDPEDTAAMTAIRKQFRARLESFDAFETVATTE